ncbi:MAG: DUF1669 domain-containing protein [Deltaproteobacteria bacterium]|nr:DUF1669 domain-containing protein [Candidatus Anaeroferrophillus wilburensis]MBN2889106.1 DUF1669 domain-containing protein [Deltaproteobacteria bacterium]
MKKTALFLLLPIFLLVVVSAAGATPVAVYFSPEGGAEQVLVEKIDGAKTSIRVAVYTFTNRVLAQALLRAQERGVAVSLILDGNDESEYSKGFYLYKRGIDVRYARGRRRKGKKASFGLMHHKFAVIDKKTVITGSYNWTASAEQWNYENLLIVNSVELALRYEQEFCELWANTFAK